jgi:hypothetical protein
MKVHIQRVIPSAGDFTVNVSLKLAYCRAVPIAALASEYDLAARRAKLPRNSKNNS